MRITLNAIRERIDTGDLKGEDAVDELRYLGKVHLYNRDARRQIANVMWYLKNLRNECKEH